ncbi:MAG: SPOR domain-containing protein [Acidobacteria bacterium]|nr:SPOR domain-containing protein [Acidobacteriota bacterium]
MTDREPEAGHELVLDNRKLIIAFAVLIAICGAFFVLGFMEGRRQGFQDGMQTALETAPGGTAPTAGTPGEAPAAGTKEEIAESDLDWYRSVNRREGDPAIAPRLDPAPRPPEPVPEAAPEPEAAPRQAAATSRAAAPAAPPARRPQARAASDGVTYSVQVGAFRARREAESAGRSLREKGFTGRIEVPDSPEGFYLVKVGKFATRAEAAAMQLRLKNSGFKCFIKTN